jgi:hypothetical protein
MMWDTVFGVANLVSMAGFATLILLPRKPVLLALVLYAGIGLLCLTYAVGLASILSGLLDSEPGLEGAAAGFGTIEWVRAIFASDGGMVVGWVHYLAFDLFVGLWIARDADNKQFNRFVQAPVLLATFLAGPLGLLVWLVMRDRRARKQGRWE